MADVDWSNIPRLTLTLDPLGQSDQSDTVTWDWTTIDKMTVTIDPLGQVDTATSNDYSYVTLIVSLDPLAMLESGTPGYPGLANGFGIIPLEFQPLPIPTAIQSSASVIIIPLGCLDLPVEYWG